VASAESALAGSVTAPIRTLSFYLMEKIDTTTKTLIPVHNASGCLGHLLRTAKGFRAFDRDNKEIGVCETASLGSVALLKRAVRVLPTPPYSLARTEISPIVAE
jgi:hypothetical protein